MKIKLKELFRKKEDDLDLDLNEELKAAVFSAF